MRIPGAPCTARGWSGIAALAAAALAHASEPSVVYTYDNAGNLLSLTSTATDPANCGGIGSACAQGFFCTSGQCVPSCTEGFLACGQVCVDTNTDAANCGGCGIRCSGVEHEVPTCFGGQCGITCAAGFTECGGACLALDSDPNNCGACGNTCPGDTNGVGAAACIAGGCTLACGADYRRCNGACVSVYDPNASSETCSNGGEFDAGLDLVLN
jgi:hypothetical protein